jgi:hypothetical protein
VDICRDKEDNLLGGEVEIIDRCKYFEELLNMNGTGSDGEEDSLIGTHTWNQK